MLSASQDVCHWHRWIEVGQRIWDGASTAAAAAKSLQSCPTLCDPIDGSPPGSSIPGILQARTLEWVAISFSYAWKWNVKVKSLSRVRLLATPWTAAYQAPPSMGFSRQEYWSAVPLPSPGHQQPLLNPPNSCIANLLPRRHKEKSIVFIWPNSVHSWTEIVSLSCPYNCSFISQLCCNWSRDYWTVSIPEEGW